MKKHIAFTIATMFMLTVSMSMTGCGARGNQFSGFSQPPKNEGILYVYRPSAFKSGGAKYAVYDLTNGKVIGSLRNGGYIRYNTKPGEILVSIVYDAELALKTALFITSGPASLITTDLLILKDLPENTYRINIRKNDISCIRWSALGDKNLPNGPVDKLTCKKEIAKTKISYK